MSVSKAQAKAVATSVAIGGVGMVAAMVGTMIAATIAITVFGASFGTEPTFELILLSILAGQPMMIVVGAAYIAATDRSREFWKGRKPTRDDAKLVVIGLAATLAVLFAAGTILETFGVETAENPISLVIENNPEVVVVLILVMFLVVGPAEEFLFRGVIHSRLREEFGAVATIAIGSLVFAAVHYPGLIGDGALAHTAVLFGISIPLAATYEKCDSIAVPIVIHAIYNSLVLLSAYSLATGLVT